MPPTTAARVAITFSRRPDAPPVSVQGADFRFRLDRNLFEPSSGPAQFGIAMDDWGNRFITSNTTHVRHVVFPWRYLRRNPFLVAAKPAPGHLRPRPAAGSHLPPHPAPALAPGAHPHAPAALRGQRAGPGGARRRLLQRGRRRHHLRGGPVPRGPTAATSSPATSAPTWSTGT